jgi:drug/metabolite transporter (DMT)-like permease
MAMRGGALPLIEDRRLAGIGLVLAAYVGFTGIDVCAKWLSQSGFPVMQVVWVRYAVHLALVVALALPSGTGFMHARRPGAVLLRGAFLLTGTVLNFFAVSYLPLTVTGAIFFTGPLFVCILAIPLLGEKVGPRRWAAIGVGFLGVLIVTRPWSAEAHWAVFLSLGAALGGALYLVLTRRLAGADSTATQQFYAALFCTVAVSPFAFEGWVWPERAVDWAALAMVGVFGWAGHQLVTIAHRFAPASALAPYTYTQILFLTAVSWAIFAQPPDIWVVTGAAVVAAAGLYIWQRERRLG